MALCSIFSNFATKVENKSIQDMLKDIMSEKFKDQVEHIRDLINQDKKDQAEHKKKLLQAFTPCGTFDRGRKADKITTYSKFLILDIDDLTPELLKSTKLKIIGNKHTYAVFVSPSGNGLKVLVRVTSELDQHDMMYRQVSSYFEGVLGVKIDPSGKDVSRLCFMSYDPNCFQNGDAVPIELNQNSIQGAQKTDPIKVTPEIAPLQESDMVVIFNRCVEFTNAKFTYQEGNRNNFIHHLACNTNRSGMPEDIALGMICQSYDLDIKEIITSIKSAYSTNVSEFAKFAKPARPAKDSTDTSDFKDALKSTPFLPDHIFDKLPSILKSGASVFTEKRKRDVFFTSALAIVSGCLHQVTGIYFEERLYPHLYTFVIAPAASGKGVLKNAKRLAEKYHQKILKVSSAAQADYLAQMSEYKAACSKAKKTGEVLEQPDKPPFKIVFIPANCSAARMIEHLQYNGGQGIICETEADAMSNAKKQEWGDYSPTLRAAFHHETITFTRKTNNEYIEIENPRIAVCLSGTPAQAPRLITSAEDGLFSRFLFYSFKNDIKWLDPSPKLNGIIHNDHFSSLSDELSLGIAMLESSPTDIKLNNSQWDILNETFSDMLDDVIAFTGEDAAASVFRLGMITFRICMVLTALRKIENADAAEEIFCSDTDFLTAIDLVKTYLQHSIIMYNNLPNAVDSGLYKKGNTKQAFIDALPDEFTTKQAGEIASQFKLSYSAISKMLPKMVPTYFTQPKSGYYIKNKD